MVGGIGGVGLDSVVEEAEGGGGLCVEERGAEGYEAVAGDGDAGMEGGSLVVEVGDDGVDGDYGLGELVGGCEGVEECVAADCDVAAGAGLVPSVAVAAEEDGGAGGVVEEVVFAEGRTGGAEEGAAGAVVADGVAGEEDGGGAGEVFDSDGGKGGRGRPLAKARFTRQPG